MGGTWRRFCSSLPYSRSVGPNIATPMPPMGLKAPVLFISSCRTRACARVSPPPPYCLGHVGVPQPFSAIAFFQRGKSGSLGPRPSANMIALLPLSDCGKFLASHSRTSWRNSSMPGSISAAADMTSSPVLLVVHQTEHALGNHIQIDLAGTALDRVALCSEPTARDSQLGGLESVSFPPQTLMAERLDQQLRSILIYLGGCVFDDRD